MLYVIPVGQDKSMGLCNQLLSYFHTLYSLYYDEYSESSVFPHLILVDYFNMCIYNPKYIPFSSIVRESCWISWIEEENKENRKNKKLFLADVSSVHDVECAMVFYDSNTSNTSNNKIVFRSMTAECIKKRYHFTMDDLENRSNHEYRTKRWKPLFFWIKMKYMFQGKTEIYHDLIKYDAQNQRWKQETLKYIPSGFRVDCQGNQEMERRRNSFFQKLSFNFTSSIFRPLVQRLKCLSQEEEKEKIKILIHLRMEKDAIAWWSKRNDLEEEEFKRILENKYDSMIREMIMLMTRKGGEKKKMELYFLGHQVHQHLLVQKYHQPPFFTTYYFDGKPENLPREIAAIYDVEWARQNRRMYDGILFPLSGSTFSMMLKLLIPSKSFFHFDMNKIDTEPIFENAEWNVMF